MKRLRKLLRLSTDERRLFISALCLVTIVRLALSIIPFRTLWRLVEKVIAPSRKAALTDSHLASEPSLAQVSHAVQVASRYIPDATCLPQALAVHIMLARRGYPTEIRIGVAKDERGKFEAHAWVESEGKVVIGGSGANKSDVAKWTPLPTFNQKRL